MSQETFAEYIARLRACEKLSESDRNIAADQLEAWEKEGNESGNYLKYYTWIDGILCAFIWHRTSQGHDFWSKIHNAGF